ncbi:cytochrome c biogenesis protein [Lutimonas zeaxanthinifaciens]|uniref:cytochrome c biogenesis protein n=1 Tax=Lutimonas zeaxanthinifaciens TaxID=3060215 RepID=UPI00265D46A4|nr:cytochrome c biogenesis protein CcsA [Lutimonas sp. YSD2104]WKK67285.1 cytochrome c biogenesis protein CcsA [Lutimonas sp. YSD2104]
MLLLFVFIIVIASATFIENSYDTTTVRLLVFNTWWFELLIFILSLLYLVNMYRKNLFRISKIPQLIFHLSFIIIILGAGITRYLGFEAHMHIVENEKVSTIYSKEPYLQIRTTDGEIQYASDHPLYFSQIQKNDFQLNFSLPDQVVIKYLDYIHSAKLVPVEGSEEIMYVPDETDQKSPDVLVVAVISNGKAHKAHLIYDTTKYIQKFQEFNFDGLAIEMAYGPQPFEMPFALQLENFTLGKYPGSDFPSSSESEVLLIDDRINVREPHLIYKNNVLDYDGYRFFQTSYDDDEKGTILTVNHDYYGTRITYLGYIFMVLGILLIIFSKQSHYAQLDHKIKEIRTKRKALFLVFLCLFGSCVISYSQAENYNPISSEHSDKFGHLVVQTYDGRFSSVHALATDILHKVSGKNSFTTEKGEKMDAMQIFLGMHVDPEYWKEQKFIRIRNKQLREMIGISGKFASFNQIDHPDLAVQLRTLAQNAFQKKASEQTNFDKELLKVVERMNVFVMSTKGTFLRLFPVQQANNNKWVNYRDSLALTPITGDLTKINKELRLPVLNGNNLMKTYFVSTVDGRKLNDYSFSNKIIEHINTLQRALTPADIVPSETDIKLEVIYTKARVFEYLKYIFALLSIVLLALSIFENFAEKPGKKLLIAIKATVAIFIVTFLVQSAGMGLRWYLSGHAPWSNGYEVLLFVAWSAILGGFYMLKYSKITLALTGLTASLLLMVAGLSYYDPQLTNLTPVLKSYWLIIHVGIITIGYSFLAISFMTGLFNIIMQIITPEKKFRLYTLSIQESTYLNEKIMTIGMFLTLIGTFIGGVWANESWGRYWGWDPKETWSLIIVLIYSVVLHFKYIPKMNSALIFNIGSVISFGSVLMTFIGVNYYFTKGLHSYASDDPPIFPIWAWVAITGLLMLIVAAIIKEKYSVRKYRNRSI